MTIERHIRYDALADLSASGATSRWIPGDPGLHVLDHAPASGLPPLLISPGISMPAIGMTFVACELTDIVRPIVMDNRGRGLSQESTSYSLEDYAADLARVITELELERPIVMGHSMGARGVAALAAQHPDIMRAGLVVDPPLSGPGRDRYPTTLEAFLGQVEQALAGTTADEVARSWPTWPRPEQELRARWLSSCAIEAVRQTHAGFESEDFFTWWKRATGTLYFVYGEQSPVVTSAGAAECASTNPSARMVSVPEAGHMIHWDAPVESAAILRRILGEILGS